ncbi:hypothetical protein A7U60_g8401 [Sanghuangporus baumii]|uniref:Mixed lineage kinase domain-containing protein n=1 Tax=Sanghuangporus baumii TaxID=108892 RepID=A0A9Q5HR15_SANBA|nr:hypothetical protein A7U60_g8401 [Sanghuangporus baumii]
MVVETSALLNVLGALSTVYTAYSLIKSNKDRCKQLVDRCEVIAKRLEALLTVNNDARIISRIGDLEKAFKKTADTITKVGQQGYVTSLLNTEENAALIEDAQRALTELITTMSLETIIDVSAWQKENEMTVRREFEHVRREIRRLKVDLDNGLASHGATIDQLTQVVEKMAKKLGESVTPANASSAVAPEIPVRASQPRGRSWSSPASVRPSIASLFDRALPPETAGTVDTGVSRKGSSVGGTRPTLPAPPFSAGCEVQPRYRAHIPLVAPSPLVQSHMSHQPSPLSQLNDEVFSDSEVPDDPPPPYSALSWEDEVTAAYERMEGNLQNPDQPTTSRSSTQAVVSFGSPEVTPSSPGLASREDKPLPDDPLSRVRQSLKRKEINNFSLMKTIGQFGKINTRVLVEMCLFPKSRAFDTAVSLDSFEPTQRDKLQLIKSRAHKNAEGTNQPELSDLPRPEYNHVLLLCPRETKPTVIIVEEKQSLPQQVVKAYILDAVEPMTLVSVNRPDRKSWLLIPYYPEMTIRKAKEYVRRYFQNSLLVSCSLPGQSKQLNENSTLLQNGVQAYNHNLNMTITS